MVAPEAQTHVPFIVWAGKNSDIDEAQLRPLTDAPLTHDDFSKILLQMFEIIVDDNRLASGETVLPMKPENYPH